MSEKLTACKDCQHFSPQLPTMQLPAFDHTTGQWHDKTLLLCPIRNRPCSVENDSGQCEHFKEKTP